MNAMLKIDCNSWLLVKVFSVTCFSPQENEKPTFSHSSVTKSVFEKLRFRDGLVLNVVSLTVEVKLRSQIPPAQCERGLSLLPHLGTLN